MPMKNIQVSTGIVAVNTPASKIEELLQAAANKRGYEIDPDTIEVTTLDGQKVSVCTATYVSETLRTETREKESAELDRAKGIPPRPVPTEDSPEEEPSG